MTREGIFLGNDSLGFRTKVLPEVDRAADFPLATWETPQFPGCTTSQI